MDLPGAPAPFAFEPPPAGRMDVGVGVDLWRLDLGASDARVAELARHLSAEERRRSEGLREGTLRRRAIVRRATLREVLARYAGGEPASIVLEREKGGRPRLEGGPPFSLSDSEDLALVAVVARGPVGVDLERVREVADAAGLAARWLPPGLPGATFLERWTRWEAALKSEGRGIFDGRRSDPAITGRATEARVLVPASGFVAAVWPPGPSMRGWMAS
jgi:4'-phosphopantetheinyl transferase